MTYAVVTLRCGHPTTVPYREDAGGLFARRYICGVCAGESTATALNIIRFKDSYGG